MDEKEEAKMAQGFVSLMEKRGLTDREAYFTYLIDQKRKKYEANEARRAYAEDEIIVLGKLIQGEI